MRRIIKVGAAPPASHFCSSACSSGDDTATEETSSSAPVSGGNLVVWADEIRTPVCSRSARSGPPPTG